MSKEPITSYGSIYFDTSFILHCTTNFIEHRRDKVKEAQSILGVLFCSDMRYYISSTVLSEIYTVVEKAGLQSFIDDKIKKQENISDTEWMSFHPHQRKEYRNNHTNFQISIKDWRTKDEYQDIYKVSVLNYIENIFDSLPEIQILGIGSEEDLLRRFYSTKKKYRSLDGNDIIHFFGCLDNEIGCILTCDKDFESVNDINAYII